MKKIFSILFLCCILATAQGKGYLVHLTIDKVMLNNDSILFKTPKSLFLEITDRTDTLEVAKVRGVAVALVVDVRKRMSGGKIINEIGYAFFQQQGGKWVIIRHFGYTQRQSFLAVTPKVKARNAKLPAHEEYTCSMGLPVWFSAAFRMDVYLN